MPRHAAAFAFLWILIAELTLLPWLHPRTDELRVNVFARRDWDRYIRRTAEPHDPERRILFISNSQCRGPEYPPEQVYTSLLQDLLNRERAGPPVRVVNWCFGPNRVPETMVLLARAHDLRPHVTVAVFPPVWFRDEDLTYKGRPTPLSLFPSDVTDTAWYYRSRLPPAFREHYLGPRAMARAWAARDLPSFVLRDLPMSWVRARLPSLAPFVPEGSRAGWFTTGRAEAKPMTSRPVIDQPTVTANTVLLRMFNDTGKGLATRRIFAFAPHCFLAPGASTAALPVREALMAGGWDVWDMMDAVPWRDFLAGENIHLTAQGHAAFARELSRRLRPLLEESR